MPWNIAGSHYKGYTEIILKYTNTIKYTQLHTKYNSQILHSQATGASAGIVDIEGMA